MKYVRIFKEIDKHHVLEAGGKGASLGELLKAGIPVPKGFVITSRAFDIFIKESALDTEIEAALDKVDTREMHTVENASERIHALIEKEDLPENLKKEIAESFRKLGTKYVAVRSSATAEDSDIAAWAGQLETYLNTTEKTLIEKVKKCWASLFSPRAIFYRFEKGFHKQKVSVAVVVQAMIESEKSGIAFSVHPVTQDKNQLIIEAGFGLGEAIVSGSITPDSYVIRKDNWKIIDRQIQTQARGLYRAKNGGNGWIALPVSKGRKPTLSDSEAITLAKLVTKIEKHHGFPVDVEWAMAEKKFSILQSRPITTLNEKVPVDIFDSSRKWVPYLTRPFNLFGASLWQSWYDSDLIKKLLGIYFPSALFIEEHFNVVKLYREANDLSAFKSSIKNIVTKKASYLQSIFEHGFELNNTALAYINGKKKCADLNEAVSFMVELALHATVIPNFALPLIVEMKKESKLQKLGEELRGKSHYPKFISHILMPLAQKKLRQLKFADGKRAIELITLQELLAGNVQELPKRMKARYKLGQRFVYQKTDKSEIVSWVADPLSLIAELEGIDLGSSKGLKQLKGQIAFKGKVKGIARVILSDNTKGVRFDMGDILVSIHSSPTLMPLILRCAAIVTDEGGISCHAAIVSRELKKPCVMSTKIATSVIKDGDLIEVDAERGIVSILKPRRSHAAR